MKKKLVLPKFKNEAQERKFWSKINLMDYFTPADFQPRLPDPKKSLQNAVRKAYVIYKKAGIDPAVWKNGRVVRLKLDKNGRPMKTKRKTKSLKVS